MFLSIIIPAYNVQNYIEKCVLCCLNQDLPPSFYEILIINDGSQDNTLSIAKEISKRHKNVKVINQKNQGLSSARNAGLKHATGEYVWFVDSDDYISSNILKKLHNILTETNLDILWLQWQRIDEQGNILPKEKNWIQEQNSTITNGSFFLFHILGMCFYAWAFIFKKSFLIENGLLFKEGIYYEDLEAIPFFILKAQKIKYEPLIAYNYLQRKGSILHSINPRLIESLLFIISQYEKKIPQYSNVANRLKEIQLFSVRLILNTISSSEYSELRKSVLNDINHQRFPQIAPSISLSGKIMNFLWKADERLIILLYNLIALKRKWF